MRSNLPRCLNSISSPMQRDLEQRQFNLQHTLPPPHPPPHTPGQDPPATRASPRWSSQFQLSRAELSQSSTIPCSRNLAFVPVGSSAQGPHRPCDQTRRLQARVSLFY